VYLYSFFNLIAKWGGWSMPRRRLLIPKKADPVPTVHEGGWAPKPVRKLPPSAVFDSRVGSKTGLHWSGNSRPHQFSIPGWAPRPVSTGPETLAITSFRSPDRPARSESLHQLRYPGPSTVRPRRTITYKANKARRNNALEYSDCCFVN